MNSIAGGLATSWQRGHYTFETCLHWLLGSKPGGEMHAQWQDVVDIDNGVWRVHRHGETPYFRRGKALPECGTGKDRERADQEHGHPDDGFHATLLIRGTGYTVAHLFSTRGPQQRGRRNMVRLDMPRKIGSSSQAFFKNLVPRA